MIQNNNKWAHTLWMDGFLTNHIQDKVNWLCICDGELRATKYCWGGNNNWLAIRHAFETDIQSPVIFVTANTWLHS